MPDPLVLERFFAAVRSGEAKEEVAYSTAAFGSFGEEESLRAIAFLVARGEAGDTYAVETLGALGREEALAPLLAFTQRPGALGAAAARALVDLRSALGQQPEPETVERVARSALDQGAVGSGMSAYRLRFLDGRTAIDGLIEALGSPYATTRANASLGLREKLGVEALIEPRQAPMWSLLMRVMSELEAVWMPAAAEAQRQMRALADGASPEDLGLVYARASDEADIAAFWTSAGNHALPWDLDAYHRLSGHDRAWAESFMLAKIWDRPQSAAVVLDLGLDGARAAVEEAARRAGSSPFMPQFRQALDRKP